MGSPQADGRQDEGCMMDQDDELTRRLPVYLLLDCSMSMAGEPIAAMEMTSATRIQVGDTLRVDDGVNIERIIITNVNGDVVSFDQITPANTLASGSAVYNETLQLVFFENGLTGNGVELKIHQISDYGSNTDNAGQVSEMTRSLE